jgi:RING finger and CHY zinc finger domain-containing protein 1
MTSSQGPTSSCRRSGRDHHLDASPARRRIDGYYGCAHYKSHAQIVAPCCGRLTCCRICHDVENGGQHAMDRFAVGEMLCTLCFTIGPFGKFCTSCSAMMARYTCTACCVVEDRPEFEAYHCSQCGICRLGARGDSLHCSTCNRCVLKRPGVEHRCPPVPGHPTSCCPVCEEDAFTSRDPIVFMRCGHQIHHRCFDSWTAHQLVCPVPTCGETLVGPSHGEATGGCTAGRRRPRCAESRRASGPHQN